MNYYSSLPNRDNIARLETQFQTATIARMYNELKRKSIKTKGIFVDIYSTYCTIGTEYLRN